MRRVVSGLLAAAALIAAPPAAQAAAPAAAPAAQAPTPAPQPARPGMPVYVVEQLVIPGPMSAELAARLQPMKTLAEVEAFLKSIGLPFMWQRSTLNTAQVDGRILTQIMQLPPGEVFVLPGQNNRVYISVIVGKR